MGDPLLPRASAVAAQPSDAQIHRRSIVRMPPPQPSPRKRGRESEVKPRAGGGLGIDNGDGAGPAGRGAADLDREATHHKPVGRERFEIVQLFEVAIADLAPGLVTSQIRPGSPVAAYFSLVWTKGASQLQPSVPVSRTPRSRRYRVASR